MGKTVLKFDKFFRNGSVRQFYIVQQDQVGLEGPVRICRWTVWYALKPKKTKGNLCLSDHLGYMAWSGVQDRRLGDPRGQGACLGGPMASTATFDRYSNDL